jgi:hypothetical protein
MVATTRWLQGGWWGNYSPWIQVNGYIIIKLSGHIYKVTRDSFMRNGVYIIIMHLYRVVGDEFSSKASVPPPD